MMPKLDLVNWTMRAAKQLRPEHHMRSDIEGPSAVSNILQGFLKANGGAKLGRHSGCQFQQCPADRGTQ